MSIENEKILNSLDVEERLNYAEKLVFGYDNTEIDQDVGTKAIYAEAHKQNPHAEFLMYKLNMQDKNFSTAMIWLKRAYHQKYPKALAFTYFEYLHGYAAFVSDNSARTALFSALEQNVPEAYFFTSYALNSLSFENLPHNFESLWSSLFSDTSKGNPHLYQLAKKIIMRDYYNSYNEETIDYHWEYNIEECEQLSYELSEKAISLGFSDEKINWDNHQTSITDMALLTIENCIMNEAFCNTRNLIYHINSLTLQKYLNNLCNQEFINFTKFNPDLFKINLKVLTLDNTENRYFLYVEILDINHKFYYTNPKYYLIILDKFNNDYVYVFSGKYVRRFNYDLTTLKDMSPFYVKGYSNDENFLTSKQLSKFNPQKVREKPYNFEIETMEFPLELANKFQEAEFFKENALEMYRLTKKGFKRFFNL